LSKPEVARARHIAKTITWRIIGTLDTMLITYFLTGDPITGLKIGGVELFTKMLLYYFHERAWYRISFGIKKAKKIE
jgi:uncharacterized membrane protein